MPETHSSSVSSVLSVVPIARVETGAISIRWGNHDLNLLAGRAVHWVAANTLIIADLHFGKAAAFRAGGVPVPAGTTQANLDRLASLLDQTQPARLIVLGDFFHARDGRAADTMNAIAHWRALHANLSIILVRGNHDQHAGDPPAEWNIHCVDEPFIEEPFAFRHTPIAASRRSAAAGDFATSQPPEQFTFAGHVHPCAILRDVDGSSTRVPCFHVSERQMILPAYGAFTGMHPIHPIHGDRIFVVADDAITEVETVASE